MFKKQLLFLISAMLILSCSKKNSSDKTKIWIYTSVYKDAVSAIKSQLEKDFPQLDINFYQAGSEEIATKFNAEVLATGEPQVDLLISSDRFWYEELAKTNRLLPFKSTGFNNVRDEWKNSEGYYSAVSLPVMVLAYNSEVVTDKDAPKTFKDLTDAKWKDKFTSGSPLSSGTNFTTIAFLMKKYGWEYIEGLKKINALAEGGNSAAMRRIQNKECPVGWVLLEDLLRLQDKDPRVKIVYPTDGPIIQMNVMGITVKNKRGETELKAIQAVAEWFQSKPGQEYMAQFYLYPALKDFTPPKGAPALTDLLRNAPAWTPDFIKEIEESRNAIKEKYTKIYFK